MSRRASEQPPAVSGKLTFGLGKIRTRNPQLQIQLITWDRYRLTTAVLAGHANRGPGVGTAQADTPIPCIEGARGDLRRLPANADLAATGDTGTGPHLLPTIMKKLAGLGFLAGLAGALLPGPASAVVVDFTGGTVTFLGGGAAVTNNSVTHYDVDYYDEGGFRLDFLPNTLPGAQTFGTIVGDYYSAGNDIIHAHWATGAYGSITAIEITKIGGGTFDLNYFILTSNTDFGGGAASGNEQAWVEGFLNNVSTGAPKLLPPENWGFPATQIFLGAAFDSVDLVRFSVTNPVDCFGMDMFYIDEPAPPPISDGGRTLVLLSLALAGMALRQRRR